MSVGIKDELTAGKGGDQEQERRFGQMEIGEELIDDQESSAGVEVRGGFSRAGWQLQAAFAVASGGASCGLEGADDGGPHGEDRTS